jgi:hypothetical protein
MGGRYIAMRMSNRNPTVAATETTTLVSRSGQRTPQRFSR